MDRAAIESILLSVLEADTTKDPHKIAALATNMLMLAMGNAVSEDPRIIEVRSGGASRKWRLTGLSGQLVSLESADGGSKMMIIMSELVKVADSKRIAVAVQAAGF